MWHKTLDLEESDRYEILTQREEMVLGSASEKHILITQSVWQSYNSGSMFAYVAHGAFGRWLHDCSASCSGWQHCEIFPKARQTPAKAHSSFSARKGQSSDGSEGFWKSGRLKKVMLKRVRKEKMNRCPCCLMYLQKLNKKSGFSSFRDLLPAYWCKYRLLGLVKHHKLKLCSQKAEYSIPSILLTPVTEIARRHMTRVLKCMV